MESIETYTDERTYADTRRPVASARTLIPAAYTSEAFFSLERERVFAASWVAVGTTSQVSEPGEVLVADVAGRSIVVVRDGDGALHGFYNVCRHRGTRLLSEGTQQAGRRIRCPYHSWTYGLDGRCLGTPLFADSGIPEDQQAIFDTADAGAFDKADYSLLPVAVQTFGCLVLVNLDPEPEPLASHLGDLPKRLGAHRLEEWEVARVAEYDIAANYKLVAENFMEYYHLPWVHPGLVKVSPMESHHRWQGTGMYTGMSTSPIAPDTDAGGWQALSPLPGLGPVDAVSARFVWLFPNVALNVMPNHLFLILATPQGPDRTQETTYLLTHPESASGPSAETGVERLATFWDKVNREDIEIVERVQQGLATTPFPSGPMCYRFEEPVHRFQNMVADRMVGIRRTPEGDATDSTPMFATTAPAAART